MFVCQSRCGDFRASHVVHRTLPGIVQLRVRVKALCRTGVQLEHVSDLGAGTLSQVPVMDAHGRAASVRYLSGHAWLVS